MKIIDMTKKSNLGGFKLLKGKAKEVQCPECAVTHEKDQPHNQQSIFYQYSFREKHGRWPTWDDAMSHCSKKIQRKWKIELAKWVSSRTSSLNRFLPAQEIEGINYGKTSKT